MFARSARIKTTLVPSTARFNADKVPLQRATSLKRHFAESRAKTMATASKIQLEASQQPIFFVKGIEEDSAITASQLLQENHEKHHIFFNKSGFHVSPLPPL